MLSGLWFRGGLTHVSSFHQQEFVRLGEDQHAEPPQLLLLVASVCCTVSLMKWDLRREEQKSCNHLPWIGSWNCVLNTELYARSLVPPGSFIITWPKGMQVKYIYSIFPACKVCKFPHDVFVTYRLHLSRDIVAVEYWLIELLSVDVKLQK